MLRVWSGQTFRHPYSLLFISGAILIVWTFDCGLQYIVDIHFNRYLNINKLLKTIGILKKAKFLWTEKTSSVFLLVLYKLHKRKWLKGYGRGLLVCSPPNYSNKVTKSKTVIQTFHSIPWLKHSLPGLKINLISFYRHSILVNNKYFHMFELIGRVELLFVQSLLFRLYV